MPEQIEATETKPDSSRAGKTRRKLIKLIACGVPLVLTGCQSNLDPSRIYREYFGGVKPDLSPEDTQEIYSVIQPLEKLLPPNKQKTEIRISLLKGLLAPRIINASWYFTDGIPANIISIIIRIKEGEKKLPLSLIQLAAFHEMIHIFDERSLKEPSPSLMVARRSGLDRDTDTYGVLISLVDESNYANPEGHRGLGGPARNLKELYASTLTTLRFFPNEFVSNFSQLSLEKQKRVAKYCLEAFFSLKEHAAVEVTEVDLPFDQGLINHLHQIQESYDPDGVK